MDALWKQVHKGGGGGCGRSEIDRAAAHFHSKSKINDPQVLAIDYKIASCWLIVDWTTSNVIYRNFKAKD